MNLQRLENLSTDVNKKSLSLARLLNQKTNFEYTLDQKRIKTQKDLLKERIDTLRALTQKVQQTQEEAKKEKSGSGINGLLGALGLGGTARALKGMRLPRAEARVSPRSPKMGSGRLQLPGFKGVGRSIPLLSAAFTGLDFLQRKQSGQTNVQAGAGAGAGFLGGLGGAVLGAKGGAAAGAAIGLLFGGVGAVPGAAIGGVLGGIAGGLGGGYLASSAADKVTGVGTEDLKGRLRESTQKEIAPTIARTPFTEVLDIFDRVLEKLSGLKFGDITGPQPTASFDQPDTQEITIPPGQELQGKAPEEVLSDAADFRKQFPLAKETPQKSVQPYELQMRENTTLGSLGNDPTVDRVHAINSAHYDGRAIDIPVNSRALANQVINFWRSRGYYVIDEYNPAGYGHIHVQWAKGQKKDAVKPPAAPASSSKNIKTVGDTTTVKGVGSYVRGRNLVGMPEDKFFTPTGQQIDKTQFYNKYNQVYPQAPNIFAPIITPPPTIIPPAPASSGEGGNAASTAGPNAHQVATTYARRVSEMNIT